MSSKIKNSQSSFIFGLLTKSQTTFDGFLVQVSSSLDSLSSIFVNLFNRCAMYFESAHCKGRKCYDN